ncbi:MAG: integrase core domain-containing protein [Acidimicrobiales bacterium]
MGDPGGPQLRRRARTRRTPPALHHWRPRHQVHHQLRRVFASIGAERILTPVRSPRANAYTQRWVRTVPEDRLDHLLVLSRRHLEAILAEYVEHYNRARPHRGLQLVPPLATGQADGTGTIHRHDILGGLIHEYELAA